MSPWVDLQTVWHGLGRKGFSGNGQITFSLCIIVCSVKFVIFVFGELASPSVTRSWACCTAQRGHNKQSFK